MCGDSKPGRIPRCPLKTKVRTCMLGLDAVDYNDRKDHCCACIASRGGFYEIDRSRVTVWDSLKKPPELYQNLVDIMQRAWSRFLKTQLGVASTPTELEFNHNKPVRISHIYFHLFKQHEYFITCIYVYMYIVFETEIRNQPLRILRMWTHALFLQRNQEGDTKKLQSTYNISNNFLYLIPCRH